MTRLGSCEVHVSPDRPKMVLSERVPVSPEFRAEMDAWMREFFGTWNLIEDSQMLKTRDGNKIFVNPRTYESIKALCVSDPWDKQ